MRHINNEHNASAYAQQVGRKAEDVIREELKSKSFFNPSWDAQKIEEVVNYGYREAMQDSFKEGNYSFAYEGESIIIAFTKGNLSTAYGDWTLTFEDILELK